jgi:hypothetical protein
VYRNRDGQNVSWKSFRAYVDRQDVDLKEVREEAVDDVKHLLAVVEAHAAAAHELMGVEREPGDVYNRCCSVMQHALSQIATHRDKRDDRPAALVGGSVGRARYTGGELLFVDGGFKVAYGRSDVVVLRGRDVAHAVTPLAMKRLDKGAARHTLAFFYRAPKTVASSASGASAHRAGPKHAKRRSHRPRFFGDGAGSDGDASSSSSSDSDADAERADF